MTLALSVVSCHLWPHFSVALHTPGEDVNLGFTPSAAQAEFLLILQPVKGSFLPGYDVGPEHRDFSALRSCVEKNFLTSVS